MKVTNLLHEWYREACVISSPLSIQKKAERTHIEFIKETLLDFFGPNYFNTSSNVDKPIIKISWILSLLSNIKHLGTIAALHEIAELIKYSKTLPDKIQSEIKQQKNHPQNLRSTFFELFVYYILDKNNISNLKKPTIGNQVIEGTCNVFEKEFLFECRKAFLPNIEELDIMRRLMMEVEKLSRKIKKLHPFICGIKMSRPVKPLHFQKAIQKLHKFINTLNSHDGLIEKIDYYPPPRDEFGDFKCIDNYEDNLIQMKQLEDYDLIFSVNGTTNDVPGGVKRINVEVLSKFKINESQIYNKLELILKEKKNQHRNSPYKNKIIILDSEIFPEFQMGLFQFEDMFKGEKVKQLYSKLKYKDILMIVRRDYSGGNRTVHVDTFCHKSQRDVATFLKSKFSEAI